MINLLKKILRQGMTKHLLWLIPLVFIAIFFFLPLGRILQVMTAREGIISIPLILKTLGFTFFQAGLSTLLTFLAGMPVAYLFSHFRFPGKRFLRLLVTLPFILPTVVVAAGYNALLGSRGWLNLVLVYLFDLAAPPITFLNTLGAILVAHVFYNTSIFIRIVGSAWSDLDVDIGEAGAMLGASPAQVMLKVTFPLLKPSILAAALLVFLFDFTSFAVILLLGGPTFATLETEIYTQALSMLNLRMAGVLSIIQLGCTLVILAFYTRLNARRSPALKPGKGITPARPEGKTRVGFVTLTVIILVLFFLTPLLSLFIRSFISFDPTSGISQVTINNYIGLFTNIRQSYFYVPPVQAAMNSLGFALFTAVLSMLLGISMAYAQVWMPAMKKWIDALIMLPLGTSAVILGLGFLITFNKPPFDTGSFPWLIPIAHTLIAFPFVLRSVAPALQAIPRNLKDAAAVLGANPWQVWWQVEAPIASKAALVGGLYAFAISLGEFGATSFLTRPTLPTLPIAIYRYLALPGDLNYGQAMAMATLLLVLCGLAMALIERIPLSGSREY